MKDEPNWNQPVDSTTPPKSKVGAFAAIFLLLAGVIILAVELILYIRTSAQGAPVWTTVTAMVLLFPVLPLLWQLGADRLLFARSKGFFLRVGLRSAVLALLTLGIAFAILGPHAVYAALVEKLGGSWTKKSPVTVASQPAGQIPSVTANPLLRFIPMDATWVVAARGSDTAKDLLRADGPEMRDRLEALDRCHIEFLNTWALVAGRADGQRLIAVKSKGIADSGKLYCLVGVLGQDRIEIKHPLGGAQGPFTVTLKGTSRPWLFTPQDENTVLMVDDGWLESVHSRLAGKMAGLESGPLAEPYRRIAPGALVWAVALLDGRPPWDLALQLQTVQGKGRLQLILQDPKGEARRTELTLDAPMELATWLPEGALSTGIMGMVRSILAVGAGLSRPMEPAETK